MMSNTIFAIVTAFTKRSNRCAAWTPLLTAVKSRKAKQKHEPARLFHLSLPMFFVKLTNSHG
jgi:hypothetical protein